MQPIGIRTNQALERNARRQMIKFYEKQIADIDVQKPSPERIARIMGSIARRVKSNELTRKDSLLLVFSLADKLTSGNP